MESECLSQIITLNLPCEVVNSWLSKQYILDHKVLASRFALAEAEVQPPLQCC